MKHVTCMIRGVWHDITCVRSWGDVWVRAATCVSWMCQREQAAGAGKQVNKAISARREVMGACGNIMEHHGEVQSGGGALWAVVWRWTYLTRGSVYQHASGALPDDLARRWRCFNVRNVICDRFEVPERLPWMEGANCSYWSTWFWGSIRQSHRVVQDSRYSTRQSNFEQKSIIYEQKTITNLVTWWSSRWSSIWRRV